MNRTFGRINYLSFSKTGPKTESNAGDIKEEKKRKGEKDSERESEGRLAKHGSVLITGFKVFQNFLVNL